MPYQELQCGTAWWSIIFQHMIMLLLHSYERRNEPREFVQLVEAPGLHIRKPHQIPVWKDIYVQSDVPDRIMALKGAGR